MNAQLRIHTLGSVSVERDGHVITDFDSRKVQALLVYLACTGRPHSREVLAELLWEEHTQSQALSNLNVALTSLRQTVGPFVTITRETVSINWECDVWLDAAAFESCLDTAGTQTADLAEAVDLYQGDFLTGFFVDSTAFEEWVTRERERLRLRVMDALATLIGCYGQTGDYPAGIAAATRLLDMDPLREETHRQLMDLLWRSGQRAKALEQYETCRRLLAEKRSISPTRETVAFYERIHAIDTTERADPTPLIRGYELREKIGEGGFGTVYRAFQPVVQREVAIKVIRPGYANQPDFIRRFETEAHLVARLEHPHIVPLYDYWREPGGAYLVMRFLHESLKTRLRRASLSVSEAVRLVEQITAALTVAHRSGVVHRDLKPANILLDTDGNAYLSDFGIAKVLDLALDTMEEGKLIGSPAYLSPEQIRNDPITPSSDCYSFGLLLYEALAGSLPFPSNLDPSALLYWQLNTPLPSLLEARPDLPSGLDAVLQRATAKNPVERFPDALSLASAFREAAGGAGLRVQPPQLAETLPENDYLVSATTWTPADDLIEARNPYKGLRAFGEVDSADFFGRNTLTDQLLGRLDNKEPLSRFLAVVGPSGSGKSSVARAGLIAALRKGALPGSENWFYAEMVPGTHPLDELEVALLRVAVHQPPSLMEQLARDEHGLTRAIKLILPAEGELFLLIDQFEEAFMLADDPARTRHLLELIHTAITDPRSRLRVVVTLRADFYDRPLMFSAFGNLLRQHTEVVLPLTPNELERAIAGPAERVGVHLEPGLTAAIVAEVSEHLGVLPMLQYALTELFEKRSDHTLTREAYTQFGGVLGVLAQRADEVFCALSPTEQDSARQIFLRLVTLGDCTEDARRRAQMSELISLRDEDAAQVLDAFGSSRLLTFDRDPATRAPTVEVAHEALLREWQRLREWLDESRNDIRQQRQLAAAAHEWHNAAQQTDFLLRGTRLEQFATWADEAPISLTQEERAYLEASMTEQERQEALERERRAREEAIARQAEQYARRARQFRRWATVLAVVFVLALVGIIGALLAANEAQGQSNIAQTNEAQAQAAEGTIEWEATYFALDQGRAATLAAGGGIVPGTERTHVPVQFIATQTQVAALNAWQPVIDEKYLDTYGVEMVLVPAGCFWMGSMFEFNETPLNEVCFDEPFWIDRLEVSNGQMERLGGVTDSESEWTGPDQPRERITWFEARAFCESRDARLPTEAEWEYAARGPDSLVHPWGNEFNENWVIGYRAVEDGTAPVGSIPEGASWVGALDMVGNVWEWTSTIYDQDRFPYPYDPNDGREEYSDDQGLDHVLRGGSFTFAANRLRGAFRSWDMAASRGESDFNVGFRCVRSDTSAEP